MKAEQQIFLSPLEFDGLKLAVSLSLDLLRHEFATDPHNTLRDKREINRQIKNIEGLRTV
ncbi:MAG: hypothetical protein JO151_17655 [Verrucomicrobia bacterium]|nr:hypothetical protein [Verrucomicrobiota bacterium]